MRTIPSGAVIAIGTLMISAGALSSLGATCESLGGTALPNTAITIAESVPAGRFAPPYGESIEGAPIAAALVALFSLLNFFGIRRIALLQNALTVLKVGLLLV
jgi:amino acid transporter